VKEEHLTPNPKEVHDLTPQSPVVIICTTCFDVLKIIILATESIRVVRKVLTINNDSLLSKNFIKRLIFLAVM
jgi:hypothetical protein